MSLFTLISPDNLPWVPSPSGAPGCFSKKLFEYDSESLARDGAKGSYTTLYRFDRNARYPTWRVVEGAVEIGVLRGILDINGSAVGAGQWVQLCQNREGWSVGSGNGCEILAIVRGRIELVRSA